MARAALLLPRSANVKWLVVVPLSSAETNAAAWKGIFGIARKRAIGSESL